MVHQRTGKRSSQDREVRGKNSGIPLCLGKQMRTDMDTLKLFHTGDRVIERPDIRIGRKNADFGQGFYLSDDEDFSRRWAKDIKDKKTYLNFYELDTQGLLIKHFTRDEEWYRYIRSNRAGRPDSLGSFDVIIGPIANDTIYDTWGILTSGLISEEQAVIVLKVGKEYRQVVIKTEMALDHLRFMGSTELGSDEIRGYREIVKAEERDFQESLAALLSE